MLLLRLNVNANLVQHEMVTVPWYRARIIFHRRCRRLLGDLYKAWTRQLESRESHAPQKKKKKIQSCLMYVDVNCGMQHEIVNKGHHAYDVKKLHPKVIFMCRMYAGFYMMMFWTSGNGQYNLVNVRNVKENYSSISFFRLSETYYCIKNACTVYIMRLSQWLASNTSHRATRSHSGMLSSRNYDAIPRKLKEKQRKNTADCNQCIVLCMQSTTR